MNTGVTLRSSWPNDDARSSQVGSSVARQNVYHRGYKRNTDVALRASWPNVDARSLAENETIKPNQSLPDAPRRRVTFSTAEDSARDKKDASPSSVRAPSPEVARDMPWVDRHGRAGTYTGQVDRGMRPHGSGALVYADGVAKTCDWRDGVPVQGWRPRSRRKERGDRRGSARPSGSGSGAAASPSDAHGTYLHHLNLGDVAGVQDSMPGESDPAAIGSLQIHDFAFVLRSGGQWTYAILADRTEDALRFVVDSIGRTKTFSRRQWRASIRLVNVHKSPMCPLKSKDTRVEMLPPPPFLNTSQRTEPIPLRQSASSIGVLSLFD